MAIRFMTAAAVAAALIFGGVATASTGRTTRAENLALEILLKDVAAGQRAENLLATVNYTGTTVGGPTWTRPFADCTGASGLGPFTYHTQPFSVTVSGNYALSSVQDGGWDGYIFVYSDPFNPAAPNTNCVIGDDDGAAGIGTSEIASVALTAGTTYVYVTTGFENGEEGTFTNTISGPGDINLGGGGPSANLGLTKSAPGGVVNGGTYIYSLAASNAGPDDATGVVVADTLPAGVSFVSSTCGATAMGASVSWNIGNLANGGNASCDLTVSRAALVCSAVSNTATISGTEPDPSLANNTATHTNGGGNVVVDGGFEAAGAVAWTQTSTNFGTPLCTTADCGTGAGTAGPRSGLQWMWFGGGGAALETGSAQQAVVVPVGSNAIEFGYWLGACGSGGAADFIRLTIDGTEVWRRDATSAECGAAGYTLGNVDITAFATGASRVVRFESTSGTAGTNSNFSIDDVSIAGTPTCTEPASADLTLTQALDAPGGQSVGSIVNIMLGVQNLGPGPANGVTVTTTLSPQLSFTSSNCGATVAGQVVTWLVGNMPNGAIAPCTLNTTIVSSGTIEVASTVASSTTDPVPGNNSASGSLTGNVANIRAAIVPTLNVGGLLALLLAVFGIASFALVRRS